MDVDPVEQWPADPTDVPLNLHRTAIAASFWIPSKSAGAGIHRGNQHQVRRKSHAAHRSGNRHTGFFQWLSKHFQSASIEFRQFVEKQNHVDCVHCIDRVQDRIRSN